MEQLISKTPRIEVVDALRGFAVMAIILVHNLEHFIFPVYPETTSFWLSAIDNGIFEGVFALFAGKAYAIFALLFGFTFHIQYSKPSTGWKRFRLAVSMAACPSHRVRNAERSIFPCRRCTVTLCRNRNCFIPRKKVERQSRIGSRNHILITTNRVVSFLRQPVYPRLPAAGFESR